MHDNMQISINAGWQFIQNAGHDEYQEKYSQLQPHHKVIDTMGA